MTISGSIGRWYCAGVLIPTVVLLLWGGYEIVMSWQYRWKEDQVQDLIARLESRKPDDVDTKVWSSGVAWIGIAAGNIFFHRGYTSIEAMSAFERGLEEKLQHPVDLSIFDWIWDRLSETGPNGKKYVERFRSQMHESLEVEKPAGWSNALSHELSV